MALITPLRLSVFFSLLMVVGITIGSTATSSFGAAATSDQDVFESREFRGSLKALKAWTSIIAKSRQQAEELATCGSANNCPPAARSWQQMLKKARTLNRADRLDWINRFFNRWPYRLDMETYGQSDYWATPREFLKNSGDCEDYAITKYWALRQLGTPDAQLRIAIVLDEIRNIGHAVLIVYQPDDILVLDNLSDVIFSHRRYEHYRPQYSFNESYRWAHIRLRPAP